MPRAILSDATPRPPRDPHDARGASRTRIHRITGFTDLDATPPATWRSPIHRALAPIELDAAAWEIGDSSTSRHDAVRYDLDLLVWTADRDPDRDPPRWIVLASGATLSSPRYRNHLAATNVIAYQLELRSLGDPRLSTIHLLEPRRA